VVTPQGTRFDFVSGCISTQGKMEFTQANIAARTKIPAGRGLWPAFWLLGDNVSTIGWPE